MADDVENYPDTAAGTSPDGGDAATQFVPPAGAPTSIGPCADETAVVPTAPESVPEFAWSDDQNGDVGGSWAAATQRASIIILAAAGLAVVVGVSLWVGFQLSDRTRPIHGRDATMPVTIAPAAAAPPNTAAPAAVPPSTVTVTPAPPSTVTVEGAPPAPRHDGDVPPAPGGTDVFSICPDGHEGVVGGHTSCAFAENVRQIFYASGMSNNFTAYSPVTGEGYDMTCVGRYTAHFSDGSSMVSTRCYGGDNAEVVVW